MPDFFCIHDYILHFGPTQWIRIINKSLEVYENEVEKDTFEQNLQKMDIFRDKCFKNNPVSQKSSPSLSIRQKIQWQKKLKESIQNHFCWKCNSPETATNPIWMLQIPWPKISQENKQQTRDNWIPTLKS